jgi:hypothetical protein
MTPNGCGFPYQRPTPLWCAGERLGLISGAVSITTVSDVYDCHHAGGRQAER